MLPEGHADGHDQRLAGDGGRRQANWCLADRYQNGDLDFDGVDYVPNTWPNGTKNHPTAFQYAGPFQASGKPYPQIQFETNVGASEILCDTATGVGCTVLPIGSKFYPFWSLSPQPSALGSHQTSCVWNFGNVLPRTIQTFGKDAQYGTPNVARFAGTSISPVQPNPEFTAGLRRSLLTGLTRSKRWGAPPARRGAPLPFGLVAASDYRPPAERSRTSRFR